MQPPNANAVRQPLNTVSAPKPATNEAATAESLGWQLRAALPPLRLHSVSLYDEKANVLWLSEGALGPDEHNLVVEAIGTLGADTTQPWHENGLEDGRVSIFLPVRTPHGALVGVAMILADLKSIGDGVVERMISPQVRTIMQKIAVLLRPMSTRATHTGKSLPVLELTSDASSAQIPGPELLHAAPVLQAAPAIDIAPTHAATPSLRMSNPAAQSDPTLSPRAVEDILEFELTPDLPASERDDVTTVPGANKAPTEESTTARAKPAVPPAIATNGTSASLRTLTGVTGTLASNGTSSGLRKPASTTGSAATLNSSVATLTGTAKSLAAGATSTSRVLTLPDGVTLILEVQPFTKLRPGGRTRRYELLARTSLAEPHRAPAGLDSLALQQFSAWLGANRSAWNSEPTSFTLNLSITTLEDPRFPNFVASSLKTHGIAAENLGFEITEALCLQHRAQVERFVNVCDKIGCFIVIDDFSLDSSVVSLLRSSAVRLVKIDPRLTAIALKDKLAQAMVVAIAQAVKVLGIHCAAKRIESQAALQWLTAIGCDFAQGSVIGPAQSLESLAKQQIP